VEEGKLLQTNQLSHQSNHQQHQHVLISIRAVQHGNHWDFAKIFATRESWKNIAENLVKSVEVEKSQLMNPLTHQPHNYQHQHVLISSGIVQRGDHEDYVKTVFTKDSWKRIAKNLVENVEAQ